MPPETPTKAPAPPVSLIDLDRSKLADLVTHCGEKPYRAKQLYRHLYVNLADDVDQMTDLSRAFREKLSDMSRIGSLHVKKVMKGDRGLTRKALFRMDDGSPVETVLMVYADRATVCVSSQSGCPMACVFCATGKLGHLHDLTAGQIVEQVLWAARTLKTIAADHAEKGEKLPDRLTNIVFMGMGEPFNNYRNWWEAVERLHDPEGFNMGARNFTVSTVGLVPGIRKLADEKLQVNLAISLHTPDDEQRTEMMPVNRSFPIADLIAAVKDYIAKTNRRVSFEYVLLQGKNDNPDQAERLARLLKPDGVPLLCHVNLIPWNPVPGTPLGRSERARVLAFQNVLQQAGIPCTVRVERGVDIGAACGQLAGDGEKAET